MKKKGMNASDDKYVLSFDKPKEETVQPKTVALEAACWGCGSIWNISLLKPEDKAVKCICGSYVVTESGKAMTRAVFEGQQVSSPLLRLDTYDPKEQLLAKKDVKGEIAGKMTTELDELIRSGKDNNLPEPIITKPDAEMMDFYENLKKQALNMGIPREFIEARDIEVE